MRMKSSICDNGAGQMNDFEHVNRSGRYRTRVTRPRRPALLEHLSSSSCWTTLLLLFLAFVIQIASSRVANAGPPPFRVGACLSANVMPLRKPNESDAQHYARTMQELKDIAGSIMDGV